MNCEKEITETLQRKINIINNSIDDIIGESYNIQLYKNMLSDFVYKYSNELIDEFKCISSKINNSIEIITSKSYLLEINKLNKIIKTNSGNFIEITTPKNSTAKNIKLNFSDITTDSITDSITDTITDSITDSIIDNTNEDNSIYYYKKIESLNNNLNKINFNVNNIKNKKILCYIVYELFAINIDFKKININCESMKKFIIQVSHNYYNNPYHNFKHAVSVLQFVHLLINKIEIKKYFSDYEIFGLLIAALVHDIGHPGHTNLFEINNKSHLALKYNDKSVLENHHCSLTFYLIHSKEINLFENLDKQNFSIVRNMIIECVLSTDMKYHEDLVSNLENILFSGYICETQQDRLLLGKILLHISDLSNQLRPFDISYQCSIDLRNEFTNQIKKEEILNLPSLDFMKLTSDKSFYSSEHYFSSNVVKSMWDFFVKIFPELNEYYNNLNININKWKEILDKVEENI